MASLPRKGVKGENFKVWAVDSINKLIDYLSSPYLQNGKGIAIRRTPSGTIIELEKPSTSVSQSAGGGGGTVESGLVAPHLGRRMGVDRAEGDVPAVELGDPGLAQFVEDLVADVQRHGDEVEVQYRRIYSSLLEHDGPDLEIVQYMIPHPGVEVPRERDRHRRVDAAAGGAVLEFHVISFDC